MANAKSDAEKLKKAKEQVKNLRETTRMLTAKHAEDQQRIKTLESQVKDGLLEIEEAYKEVLLKSICEAYGEPVLDDETKELLGKRLEFKALRKNNYKVNMSETLIYPEDERFISTITVGVTYPATKEEEENNGKN